MSSSFLPIVLTPGYGILNDQWDRTTLYIMFLDSNVNPARFHEHFWQINLSCRNKVEKTGACGGLFWGICWIIFINAFGTDTMAELSVGPVLDILLNLVPEPLIIPDFFTACTDRD